MPRVELKVVVEGERRHDGSLSPGSQWYVEAPDFCPYKHSVETYGRLCVPVVDPAVCRVCKICTFVPLNAPLVEELTAAERQAFVDYLIHEPDVSSSVSAQDMYLRGKNRLPIAVLISFELFDAMLHRTIPDAAHRQAVQSYVAMVELPVCYVIGCPVYLSRKLTKARVQVVGEVDWK